MSRLPPNSRDCVLVLLGGKITSASRVSALAEVGLVRCGDELTPAGAVLAYKTLAERIPQQTPELHTELLWAAAHAARGLDPPRRWLAEPHCTGWYWIKPLDNDPLPLRFFERPYLAEKRQGLWLISDCRFPLGGRSVLPILLPPAA